ncbi:MAG: transcription termination/antitermination protein NusG [Alphaproteobacteria bacterium]
MRWYVLQVHSGFEGQVRDAIREKALLDDHLKLRVGEVLVPTEDVMEVRRGQKHQSKRKFFPGYVLVQSEMDDIVCHKLKNMQKVTDFLGTMGKPVPLPRAEEQRLLEQVKEGVTRARPAVTFEIGEKVRVAHGPFSSFNGLVEEVDEERARLKVSVSIFGRSTPVDLEYSQVEKI